MELKSLIVFIDQTGRTIYGKVSKETDETVHIDDPAQIYVQPTPQGQLNVQSIPLFFREFVKNQGPVTWVFSKKNITLNTNLELDERLVQQYNNILNRATAQAGSPAQPQGEAKVIKLFDDE